MKLSGACTRPGKRKVAGETSIERLIPLHPPHSHAKAASITAGAIGLQSVITPEL